MSEYVCRQRKLLATGVTMHTIRVAVVQMTSTEDEDLNLVQIERLVARAVAQGAAFVVLPENAAWLRIGDAVNPGHRLGHSAVLSRLASLAQAHRISLLLGSILIARGEGERPTNTSLLFDLEGRVVARYDKIHLFRVDIGPGASFDETRHISAGDTPVVAGIAGIRVGMTICYDLRFPGLFQALRHAGADIIAVPSAFTVPTGRDHWEVLLRARAIETQCYVVAAAQWGYHGGQRTSFGRSCIIDPWGTVLACVADGVGFAVADLDLERMRTIRKALPCAEHIVKLAAVADTSG